MSDELSLLRQLVDALDSAGIPYMVAGSIASSFLGEPRTTNDIDVVIDPTPDQLEELLSCFGEGYYVSHMAARQALFARTMFNVIDHASGMKIDFIIRKSRRFSHEEFGRRQPCTIGTPPLSVTFASAEDVILSKLEWAKLADSERQLRDAIGVALLNAGTLDRDYLRAWAGELELGDQLAIVEAKLDAPEGGPGSE